jgi:hypothetical protein
MRNKISCTAQKLSHLEPEMIQSVVGTQVFQFGREYHSANCVQIVEASEDQILSEVNGPFGLYEQTIQLKGGNLLTKCSCTSNEQPFCRHCVAVLLSYRMQKAGHQNQFAEAPSDNRGVSREQHQPSLSVNLHHITIFIEWLQQAVRALDLGEDLPEPPALDLGDMVAWVRTIQSLHARWRISEDKRLGLEAELGKRQGQLDGLMNELEAFPREAKAAQATCEGMQHALTNCRAMLSRLSDMAKERDNLEEQLKTTTNDLLKKGAELNSLAASMREVYTVIQGLAGPLSH